MGENPPSSPLPTSGVRGNRNNWPNPQRGEPDVAKRHPHGSGSGLRFGGYCTGSCPAETAEGVIGALEQLTPGSN